MLVGSYPFKATNDRKLIDKMLSADFVIPDHFSEGKNTSAPFLGETTHLIMG